MAIEKPSWHGDDLQLEGLSVPRPLCGRDTRDDGPNGSYEICFFFQHLLGNDKLGNVDGNVQFFRSTDMFLFNPHNDPH